MQDQKSPRPDAPDPDPDAPKPKGFEILSDNEVILTWQPAEPADPARNTA